MFEFKPGKIVFFAIVAVALVSYVAGLSVDVTRDASKYATISKEIFQHGNYINLTIHGDAYDQKPPLLFWLGALGFSIGGISNFWFKLPVLLVVFAGFYWAFKLGESLYNKRIGSITSFLMAFSLIYSMYSMDIHTDTPMQAFITLALWQLSEFVKTKKTIHSIIGFGAVGLAMLCKGPVGAAIPAFAVIGHVLLKKDTQFLFDYRWFLGILIAFVVVSPAVIGLWNQFGWEGIRFFIWDNNVGRISGSYVKAENDPVFYVHTLLYLFLPWSLLFFIAAFYEFRFLFKNKFKTHEFFTLSGIWIFFIIINASKSQLPNYIFGIVPLIAVLTAKWIDNVVLAEGRRFATFVWVQAAITFLIWIFILYMVFFVFTNLAWFNYVLIVLGIGVTLLIYSFSSLNLEKVLLPPAIVFSVLIFMLNTSIYPEMFGLQAPPQAARYFSNHADKEARLFNYDYGQYELFFYSEPQALQVDDDDDISAIAAKKGNWIFTTEEGLVKLQNLDYEPDTTIRYDHYSMRNAALYFYPKARGKMHKYMYLLKY